MDFFKKVKDHLDEAFSDGQAGPQSSSRPPASPRPEQKGDLPCVPVPTDHRYDSFAPESSGKVKWYVDGASYFWAVSIALQEAQESIYILDWWLSPELYLRRPPSGNQRFRLDNMLKSAAERGVKVHVIVYKEVTQALTLNSEHTRRSLEALHPNIKVFRHPDHIPRGANIGNAFSNMSIGPFDLAKLSKDSLKAIYGAADDVVLFWAHHEKLCIVDHRIAFMGGLDMCFGRYDTNSHPIADAHPTNIDNIVFPGQDYNNARIYDFNEVERWEDNKLDRMKNSRMGWSDISISLAGPILNSLIVHFTDRWNFIWTEKYLTKNDGKYKSLDVPSLDASARRDNSQDSVRIQLLRSCSPWSGGHPTEHSILNAYVDAITHAEHFVYIENQFFITATGPQQPHLENRIGAAIVERIVRAHDENQPFNIWVIMPAVPAFAGDLRSDGAVSTRAIMQFQYRSISRGRNSIIETLRARGVDDPYRYINFYNLRNFDRINSSATLGKVERKAGVSYESARKEFDNAMEQNPDGTYPYGDHRVDNPAPYPSGCRDEGYGGGGGGYGQSEGYGRRQRGGYDNSSDNNGRDEYTGRDEYGGGGGYGGGSSSYGYGERPDYAESRGYSRYEAHRDYHRQPSGLDSDIDDNHSSISATLNLRGGGPRRDSGSEGDYDDYDGGRSSYGRRRDDSEEGRGPRYYNRRCESGSGDEDERRGGYEYGQRNRRGSGGSDHDDGRREASYGCRPRSLQRSGSCGGNSRENSRPRPQCGQRQDLQYGGVSDDTGEYQQYGRRASPPGLGEEDQPRRSVYGQEETYGRANPTGEYGGSSGYGRRYDTEEYGTSSSGYGPRQDLPSAYGGGSTGYNNQRGPSPPRTTIGAVLDTRRPDNAKPSGIGSQYDRYQAAAGQVTDDQPDNVTACVTLTGPPLSQMAWYGSAEAEMQAFVSEELYVHSKVLIADDRIVICGSANLNDRSQLGDRDSEIAVMIEDPREVETTMAGRPWRASVFAASLRRQLFRKHLGLLPHQKVDQPDQNWTPVDHDANAYDWDSEADRKVVDPLSPEFVELWCRTARTNTEVFSKVFHCIPNDRVRTWEDYDEFFSRHFIVPGAKKAKDEKDKDKEEGAGGKVDYGHVVPEEFPGGPAEVKEWLGRVRGTLVEMPLSFLVDVPELAEAGMAYNAITATIYT